MSVSIPRDRPLSDANRYRLQQLGDSNTIAWIDANYPAEVNEEVEAEEAPFDYPGWTKAQLTEELLRRELSIDGKVADLRARLMENDAESEEDSDEADGDE